MTNTSEKSDHSVSETQREASVAHKNIDDATGEIPRPRGWMYKSGKIGRYSIPWYASPRVQLGLVSGVCFLCPGMYNALSGLGGGGKKDATLADQMVSEKSWPTTKPITQLTGLEYCPLQYLRSCWLRRWGLR